ncbi:MAG: hypothetical protein OXC05_03520 [Halieaceae bacterium]|nr:hypothetical protein [Halieaceae bacterium]
MDVIYESEGLVQFIGDDFERTHTPLNDELWQESFVLYFWDAERECYAFLRLSQTPNFQGGTAQVMSSVWTPEYFYKHTDDLVPFDDSCRTETALTDGKSLLNFSFDGNYNWQLNDPEYDVEADLVFTPYHQGVSYFPGDSQFVKDMISNHTQAFGRTRGTLRVKDKSYDIDGFAWRDHSHGIRKWLSIRGHRFFCAIFDENCYLASVVFVGADGTLVKSAVLVTDGKMHFVTDLDVVLHVGEDLVSNCGGKIIMNAAGKNWVFEYEPIAKSAVIMVHGLAMTEGMCRVRCGDRIGVGLTESTNNPHAGGEPPFVFSSSPGIMENGVYTPDEFRIKGIHV